MARHSGRIVARMRSRSASSITSVRLSARLPMVPAPSMVNGLTAPGSTPSAAVADFMIALASA